MLCSIILCTYYWVNFYCGTRVFLAKFLFTAGDVLDTGLIFPFGKKAKAEQAKNIVVDLVKKHR